jgi:hypothetical protein
MAAATRVALQRQMASLIVSPKARATRFARLGESG